MQKAFSGPLELRQRIGSLDAADASRRSTPSSSTPAFRTPPALHRFPGNMAKRVRDLCAAIADDYDGDASRIWSDATDAQDLHKRLIALPGIGEMKAARSSRCSASGTAIKPAGWDEVVPEHPTLGDVDSRRGARRVPGGQARAQGRRAGRGRQGLSVNTVDVLATCATIAGVLMAMSPFLQVRRMRRTKSSNDVSLLYLSMLAGGFIVWLAYGLSLDNWAMIISNIASLIFMVITIFVALTYRRGGAKRAAAGAAALAPAAGPGARDRDRRRRRRP